MPATSLRCPGCGRAVSLAEGERPAAFPFCSPRCRASDLGAWFAGRYTVAGEELEAVDRRTRAIDRSPEA
jgi:hypothetical protein